MTICIIDYGAGNLHSAAKAVTRAAEAMGLSVTVSRDANALASASHIILPGVGAFADCMQGLRAAEGMIAALEEEVLHKGKPFLGICVGAQMLLSKGTEHGEHAGLGWIPGEVVPISTKPKPEWMQGPFRVPHMGWNTLDITQPHPCLADWQAEDHAYFVHSFHAKPENPAHILATSQYGGEITACIGRDNLLGTQFHPEKSGASGLKLIENFVQQ